MSTPSVLLIPDLLKAGKLYSQIPNSGAVDFDVTRATTAFRTNASGVLESVASGVPRLDYPIGGGCPSLLVEPAATNLLLRSEEFNDASWSKIFSSITANAGIAPNGTLTADSLIPNTTLEQHRVDQTPSSTAASQVFTIYAKSNGYSFIGMRFGLAGALFNLSNGLVSLVGAGLSATTQNAGNGWYRCTLIKAAGVANEAVRINVSLGAAIAENFAGDGTSGVLLWGAQLEVGSVATSYIPTVAATATRNADVISKTGVSGFIGQAQGTLYAEFVAGNFNSTNQRRVVCISDGTLNNRIIIGGILNQNNRFQAVVVVAGVTDVQIIQTVDMPQNSIIKAAIAYSTNDVVFYINGVQIGLDTSVSIPACNRFDVGNLLGSEQFINGAIRTAATYPIRLSNAQLASLTTL
jgi:hypothetical protein